MNAFVPSHPSRGIQRIADALRRHAPSSISISNDPSEADLIVLFVNGRRDRFEAQAERIRAQGRRYAVVQIALRSTQKPSTHAWLRLWTGAVVVWSYYDLRALMAEDGDPFECNIYHAPLGVDSEVFCRWPGREHAPRAYTIATSGLSPWTESVRECALATERVQGSLFYLGPSLTMGPYAARADNISDDVLAMWYRACRFVSGLRRIEGFELPAAEGLLCGAQPVLFDRPHYRRWFEPWAEFIPEGRRESVVDALEGLFRRGPRSLTDADLAAATARFDWRPIVSGFWERCT